MTASPQTTVRSWELFSTQLRSFFAQRVPDEQAVEDLLQETFLRVHQNVSDLNSEERLAAWIFRIAHNLVVDHRRSRRLEIADDETLAATALPETADDNLNHVVRAWLPAMIAELPETTRTAVELFEIGGVRQQAIADRLGLSLSGAKSRIQRGRDQLKALLLDCCSFERDRRGNIIDYSRRSPTTCGPCEGVRGQSSSSTRFRTGSTPPK